MTGAASLLKTVGGHDILYVMAAKAEYGPHLRARFIPVMTGVGPVEAAVEVTRALADCAAAGSLPDLVVSLGSAGSRTLEQAEVYQITAVSYRDMDASALGFEKGRTPFLDLPAVVRLPYRVEGLREATIATGASIVSGGGYDGIDADMVDMETWSVLRSAMGFGVPVIGLRGISDGAAELHRFDDWTQYLHVIDEKLADAVDRLEKAVAAGEIAL